MKKTLRLLAIGHSYVLAVNRATLREIARDPLFEITVAAPAFFHGDLRPITCEAEPPSSNLRVVPIPARFTSRIHVFRYCSAPLRSLFSQNAFDCVYAWEEPYVFAGYQIGRAAARTTARFAFRTAQSLNKHYLPPFGHFEKATLSRTSMWVAGGKSVFNNLVNRGYPADRGRVITLAVDTAMFQPAPEPSREAVRRELGLEAPVIGYIGRLVPAKGLHILMQALERLDPAIPWSLLLLGSGEMKDDIEQWAASRGWGQRVKIHLAKHDEVPKFVSAMDLLVAPSQTMPNWKEQFGRMLIEAFACAVPVIGSDSGEIPNVIGDAGFIVPEKDVSAWSQKLGLLLKDPQLRRQTGLAGLNRVETFSARTVAGQFKQFYRQLAEA